MRGAPEPWTVEALNLPEHGRNPIHTDAGARAAGFPRALVAGVTTYAYLTHPIAAAWGLDWLGSGGGEVRFRAPVFQSDRLLCLPVVDGDDVVVEARSGEGPDQPRATLRAVARSAPVLPLSDGEPLTTYETVLTGEWGDEYGSRAGDDLPLYRERGVVHPAVWPALANHIVHTQVARGPWIHMRSIVRHHALAAAGSEAAVSAVVVRRFERSGERAVLDVRIEVAGVVVATLEHEAIVALRPGT